jgi:DNA-binding SARP family transcriptional activator
MVTDLSLALLGPPVVRRDGAPVTFDTRKATALLALLAVTGREHSREQLADLLWPDADSVKGRASLRRTLSVSAAAMGDGLVISRAAVALDPAAVRVDVREFNTLIGRPDAASLEQAASLYRDDFLAGFALPDCPEFEEWQASVCEELRQALARGLQRLVAVCIADGALERAAGHARRWLQLDPLHEPAHQAIIMLYGWAGNAPPQGGGQAVRLGRRGRRPPPGDLDAGGVVAEARLQADGEHHRDRLAAGVHHELAVQGNQALRGHGDRHARTGSQRTRGG